jgi:hypothetical protein
MIDMGPSGIRLMNPKQLLKSLCVLSLALMLVSCGSDGSPEITASNSADTKSDPFWDTWVAPQPDKTPVIEEGQELADPFQKA